MYMPTLKRQWTVDDLEDLPDDGNRYEIIDGELFVTPAPSLDHQEAVLRFATLLSDYVRREGIGYLVVSPADVTFSKSRSVQPDLFVVPSADGRRPRHFRDVGRLLLAVEILSPSTARADRVAKRTLFREEHVPEYWIVDLDSRTVDRSTPGDSRMEVASERLTWHPDGAAAPLVIDLADYFARILDD
jgi:Uma2 family endonuclease